MANLSEFQQGQWAVGSVQQSLLTEVQFQAEMGTDWVLMDGQTIAGSKLESIIGDNLPDARDNFMRMNRESVGKGTVAGEAQLLAATLAGTVQGQATAKNSLGLTWNSTNMAVGDQSANHNHDASSSLRVLTTLRWSGTGINYNFLRSSAPGTATIVGDNSADHNHAINKNQMDSDQNWAQDTETRPPNITVNYFVKIN